MAAKKINIKTRIQRDAEKSPKKSSDKLGLVKKPVTYPKSYRWRKYDILMIEELIMKTKGVGGAYKVDATKLIRGALLIASKKSPEKLIDSIMEAERNSIISKIE